MIACAERPTLARDAVVAPHAKPAPHASTPVYKPAPVYKQAPAKPAPMPPKAKAIMAPPKLAPPAPVATAPPPAQPKLVAPIKAPVVAPAAKLPAVDAKMAALSTAVSAEAIKGAVLTVPDTLAKGQESKVSLSLPVTLLDVIRTEPERFRVLVRQALMLALAIMGLGALVIWFGIGRNALRRIDRMTDASRKIMAGDLSQRLPVGGSGDEFRPGVV